LHNETLQSRPCHNSAHVTPTPLVTIPPPSQPKMRLYHPVLVTGTWLGAGAFLCLSTLCVSVSAASGAQSQVKYPPPTVQSVRGACPPRPLSLWLTAPGYPPPLTTWKISASMTRINWVLKHQFYPVVQTNNQRHEQSCRRIALSYRF